MNERRAHIRISAGIEGTYQLLGDLSGPRLGMTRDLSLGGARVSSASRLPAGEKVTIQLALPKQGAVAMTGVVVWSREKQESGQQNFETGLRWLPIDPHAQARLNAFITDYTWSESIAVSSSGQLLVSSPVNWLRAFALALGIFGFTALIALIWVRQLGLEVDAKSLNRVVKFYQYQISALAQQTRAF